MNLGEANELRKELLDCHLKDKNGDEIKRIAIPNRDDSKYEGCALKLRKTRLDEVSFYQLENICKEHKLQLKDIERKGCWTIYTPKKP